MRARVVRARTGEVDPARPIAPRLAIGIAGLIVALAGGAARAGADVPLEARQLGDRGRALFRLHDYDRAIAAFRQAYAIAPSPALLFDLAQAYRLTGDCGQATAYYRRFLSTGEEPAARGVAQAHLEGGDACARRASGVAPDAGVGAVAGTSNAGRDERRLGLALAGGGSLALSAGLYFAIDAHRAGALVTRAYETGADWATVAPIDARGRRSSQLARDFAITGGVTVAAGVALYLLGRRGERAARRAPAITFVRENRGGRVGLTWSF